MSAFVNRAVILKLALLLAACFPMSPVLAENELAIGKEAKVAGWLSIPVNMPANFNFKKQDEVLTMRRRAVENARTLMKGTYEPTAEIFGAIEDGRPWWGLAGSHVWGKGDRSIEGPAEESRFILNPFLLVAIDPATLLIWNPGKISKREADDCTYPYSWFPEGLKWNPRLKTAEVTYNVTRWHNQVMTTGKLSSTAIQINQFSLVAYNARDMGMHYIFLDTAKSQNVKNDFPTHFATEIKQMLHCGGTCGYPGGCNNMSPFMPEIDRCRLTALPAQAVVNLWEEPPDFNTPPDMTWVINFK